MRFVQILIICSSRINLHLHKRIVLRVFVWDLLVTATEDQKSHRQVEMEV
jgi:hypothetical protein